MPEFETGIMLERLKPTLDIKLDVCQIWQHLENVTHILPHQTEF